MKEMEYNSDRCQPEPPAFRTITQCHFILLKTLHAVFRNHTYGLPLATGIMQQGPNWLLFIQWQPENTHASALLLPFNNQPSIFGRRPPLTAQFRRSKEIFLKFFIYLFLAALGFHCCARAFSSCGEQGLLFVVVRGLLIVVASLAAEHGL